MKLPKKLNPFAERTTSNWCSLTLEVAQVRVDQDLLRHASDGKSKSYGKLRGRKEDCEQRRSKIQRWKIPYSPICNRSPSPRGFVGGCVRVARYLRVSITISTRYFSCYDRNGEHGQSESHSVTCFLA